MKRATTKALGLSAHPFMKDLVGDIRPLIESAQERLRIRVKEHGFKKIRREANLPQPYSYMHGVFYYAGNLIKVIDRLHEIRLFIRTFPDRKRFEGKGITQDKWIQYHHANYITTFVSAFDTSLILVNYVFRLGVPTSKCRPDVIMENNWVSGTPVRNALKRINKVIEKYRSPRHSHVHRGEMPDLECLDGLEVFSHINLISSLPVFPPKELKLLYRMVTRDIERILNVNAIDLSKEVAGLLDALRKIYKRELSSLPMANPDRLKGKY